MSNPKQARKVYYCIVKGNGFVLADERNKKRFLDISLEVQQEEKWVFYAFCITDNEAYFITESGGLMSLKRGLRKIAKRFFKHHVAGVSLAEGGLWMMEPGEAEELSSLEEIAVQSRMIHRIPLEEGYVSVLEDYWWSSYVTYLERYDWGMVEERILSSYFATDSQMARRRLQEYTVTPRLVKENGRGKEK